jgi:peptide chain release factor 3
VVGLVNATDVRVGDTLWFGEPVTFPRIPSFAPEHFSVARVRDTARFKQFRRGIAQLDEEGVVQVLRDPDRGDQAPVLAAVGPMQFDVAVHRLENEFGAPVELSPTTYSVARAIGPEDAEFAGKQVSMEVLTRTDGVMLALFTTKWRLQGFCEDNPTVRLRELVAAGDN